MASGSLFFHKDDSGRDWYETHDGKLLPIVEAFKT